MYGVSPFIVSPHLPIAPPHLKLSANHSNAHKGTKQHPKIPYHMEKKRNIMILKREYATKYTHEHFYTTITKY